MQDDEQSVVACGTVGQKATVRHELTCTVDGTPVLLECKRPLSDKTVPRRINEARRRVLADLKSAATGARGAIAISFTKPLGHDDDFLDYSDEAAARARVDAELVRLAAPTRELWTQLPDKIVAMMFHLMVIAVHRESGRFDRGQQWLVYTMPTSRPNAPRGPRARGAGGGDGVQEDAAAGVTV